MINRIAILVINWNDYDNTHECLQSLLKNNKDESFTIVLLDNNSHDWSYEKLVKDFSLHEIIPSQWNCEKKDVFTSDDSFSTYQSWHVCLKLNDNYGFTWANNFGMKFARQHNFSHIMWLNNDTLVKDHFIENMLEWAKIYNNHLLSCRILFYPDSNYIWSLGATLNWFWKPYWINTGLLSGSVKDLPRYIKSDLCTWCLLLMSRSVLAQLWWQDNDYFFNIDDSDYSFAAKKLWIETFIDTKTELLHKSARSVKDKPWLSMYYWMRNLVLFRRKFFPFYKNIVVYIYIIIHAFWASIVYGIRGAKTKDFLYRLFYDIIHKRYGRY